MYLELSIIFILTILLIKMIIYNASDLGLIDVPNARSVHHVQVPSGAGVGFVLSVFLIEPFFNFQLLSQHYLMLIAFLAVFIVGILDDYKSTSHYTKFAVLSLASLVVYFDGISVTTLGELFGFTVDLGWFALPFTLFAIVGFTNALNLIDGLDGLAGSISLVILGTLLYIAYINDDLFMILLSSGFITSLSAFLIYNWNPATVFMGDSGSLVLGFLIGILVIKAANYVQPVTVLFLIALPVIDTIIVMVRRKRDGVSMFHADKTHLHHILLHFFNNNVKKTVIFLVLLQTMYSLTGLMIVNHVNQSLSLVLFALNVVVFYIIFTGMLQSANTSVHKK